MSSIQPIYGALAGLLATFITHQTTEAAKALRKGMRDVQREHDGRVPEEIRPQWKDLHPQLGAFIDGRQPVEGTVTAARTLADILSPPEKAEPEATEEKPKVSRRKKSGPSPVAEDEPDPVPDPQPAPAEDPTPAE